MMKQRKAYSTTLAMLFLASAIAVSAQPQQQQSGAYVAPSIGYYFFDGDEDRSNNAEDGLLYGLSIGYQINNNFAIEANYSGVQFGSIQSLVAIPRCRLYQITARPWFP